MPRQHKGRAITTVCDLRPDETAHHPLPPICCCAYSPLFHPSNNGRRMRENASVSMAQPLIFHYYTHKSSPQPPTRSLLPPFPLPPFLFLPLCVIHKQHQDVFRWRNVTRTYTWEC